jgi:DNA repair exonuclease SbcCD ATPase subunit
MNIDERIEKLEHVTAAHIEQAKKDYEENRRIQRDLQSHIDAIWKGIERRDQEYAEQKRETDQRLRQLGEETDRRIRELVSAIGDLIQRLPVPSK